MKYRDGSVSADQNRVFKKLTGFENLVAVCWDADTAISVIEAYLGDSKFSLIDMLEEKKVSIGANRKKNGLKIY